MTSQQFKEAREKLGFTQAGIAREWNMGEHGGRTVRRWELGQVDVPGPVAYLIKMMLANVEVNAPE